MKYIFIIIIVSFLCSCCSLKIGYNDTDLTLIFQNDDKGGIWISSMNSAEQINITNIKKNGDTLLVSYKRGLREDVNCTLPLTDDIKYLKCANKLYKVNYLNSVFILNEVK